MPPGLLTRHPWLTFLLPFIVYMAVGSLEPTPPPAAPVAADGVAWGVQYRHYPVIYTLKILATAASMLLVLPGYQSFPLRVSPLGLLTGGIGGVVWIVLAELQLEPRLLGSLGMDWFADLGARPAFNPLDQIQGNRAWAVAFLFIRFSGLVLLVPIIEEFFLRGFVMRVVMDADWWKQPFGQVDRLAILVGTAVPMLTHPGELLAALVWFSMITWLMIRTRSIWDCIVAHAVTNLMLGIYVVSTGSWFLM